MAPIETNSEDTALPEVIRVLFRRWWSLWPRRRQLRMGSGGGLSDNALSNLAAGNTLAISTNRHAPGRQMPNDASSHNSMHDMG
jgi:hypothetical protein